MQFKDKTMNIFTGGLENVLRLTIVTAFVLQSADAGTVTGSSPQAIASSGLSRVIITGSGFAGDTQKGCAVESLANAGHTTTLDVTSQTDTQIVCEWSEVDKQAQNWITGMTGSLGVTISYKSGDAQTAISSPTTTVLYLKSEYDAIDLNPNVMYGPVDGTTKVVLSADSKALPESADARCLVSVKTLAQASYAATFVAGGTYECTFTSITAELEDTAVEESIRYRLSLSNDEAEIIGQNQLNFSYVMPGPQVSGVVPTRGGLILMLTWNWPVMTGAQPLPTDCTAIFTSTSVLGSGATCAWPTSQQIEINLGTGSSVQFGNSNLEIVGDLFYRTQKTVTWAIMKTAVTSVSVGALVTEPTVAIIGPQKLLFCDNILNGFDKDLGETVFQTRVEGNLGPNVLTYSWSIVQKAHKFPSTTSISASDTEGVFKGYVPGTYTLHVTVAGTLSATPPTATMEVTVSFNANEPTGYFASGSKVSVIKSEGLDLMASIVSTGCVPMASPAYSVKIENKANAALVAEAFGTELAVGKNKLDVGTVYVATFRETTTGVIISSADITVKQNDLSAVILGGSKVLVPDSTQLTLDAAWPDPDVNEADASSTHVTYNWACTSGACTNEMPSNTNVKSMQLVQGLSAGTYAITLTVTVGVRTAKTTIALTVGKSTLRAQASDRPAIGLHLQNSVVRAGSDIVIVAAIATSVTSNGLAIDQATVFGWTTTASDETSSALDLQVASNTDVAQKKFSNTAIAETLVVNGDKPVAGRSYSFRATATLVNTELAWAEFTVDVPYPPGNPTTSESDRVKVNPQSGTACTTPFVVSAHGYKSESLVTFEFAMKDPVGEPIIVHTSHASTTSKGIYLPAGITKVGVRAFDRNGFTAWSWTDVSVTSNNDAGAFTALLDAMPSFANFFLVSKYQQLVVASIQIASSPLLALLKDQAFSLLSSAATVISGLRESPYRRNLLMLGVSALKAYADTPGQKGMAIIGVALNTFVSTFSPGVTSTADIASALGALPGVASRTEIAAILSTADDTRLLNIASILKSVRAPLCGSIQYGQPQYSFGTPSVDLVSVQMARSPAAGGKLSIAGNGGMSMTLPSGLEADVARTSSCAEDLASGNSNSAASCIGGCLIMELVAGNIQGLLDPSGATVPIPADIASDSVSLWVQNAAGNRRRQRRATENVKVVMSLPSQKCSDGTSSCECREWDSVSSEWAKSATGGVFQGLTGECTFPVDVGLSNGPSYLQSVATFSSCGPGYLGRGCLTSCPAGKWGQDCANTQDCNGMTLNPVDGSCQCLSGWTGGSCDTTCTSFAATSVAKSLSSDTLQQGYGVGCGNQCACHTKGTLSCDIYNGTCVCKGGYSGTNCDVDVDDCTLSDGTTACKNDGLCTDRVEGFRCNCASTGFEGTTCEDPVGYCAAATSKCLNDALCVDQTQFLNFTCTCPDGFTGDFCESYCSDGQWGPDCTNECTCVHGVCHAVTGACACDEGYEGGNCDAVPVVKNMVPLIAGATVGAVVFCVSVVLVYCFCKKRAARKQNHTSNLAGLSASRFEAAVPFPGSSEPVSDPDAPVGLTIEKVDDDKIKIKMNTPYISMTHLAPDTTLALLRDKLCSMSPEQFGEGDDGKFYFEKLDGSGSYVSTHEMTHFAIKCYPENVVNVRFTRYDEVHRLEFCICGRVSVFECSMCSKQGYCSEQCQRGDWKLHRVGCRAQSAKEEAKTDALAAKLSTASAATAGVDVAADTDAGTATASDVAAAAPDDESTTSVADPVLSPELDTCAVCGTSSQFECSSCGLVGYCSKKCQRADWPTHKILCKAALKAKTLAVENKVDVIEEASEAAPVTDVAPAPVEDPASESTAAPEKAQAEQEVVAQPDAVAEPETSNGWGDDDDDPFGVKANAAMAAEAEAAGSSA